MFSQPDDVGRWVRMSRIRMQMVMFKPCPLSLATTVLKMTKLKPELKSKKSILTYVSGISGIVWRATQTTSPADLFSPVGEPALV